MSRLDEARSRSGATKYCCFGYNHRPGHVPPCQTSVDDVAVLKEALAAAEADVGRLRAAGDVAALRAELAGVRAALESTIQPLKYAQGMAMFHEEPQARDVAQSALTKVQDALSALLAPAASTPAPVHAGEGGG